MDHDFKNRQAILQDQAKLEAFCKRYDIKIVDDIRNVKEVTERI